MLARNNPFALVVLAAQKALLQGKVPEEELLKHKLMVAKALIASKKLSKKQIERFLFFLERFIHIENEEINRKFNKQINQLTGKKNAMGIIETIKMLEREEGREEGRKEGIAKRNREIVRNLLVNTDFSISKIASIALVTESYVRKVRKELDIK